MNMQNIIKFGQDTRVNTFWETAAGDCSLLYFFSNFKRVLPLIDVRILFPLDICEKRKKICIYVLIY